MKGSLEAPRQLVTFNLDYSRFALDVAVVQRVLRAVAVTPLPGAPAVVAGIVDLHGTVVPVVDTRAAFGLAPRRLRASDQLVIVATSARTLALVVDAVGDVLDAGAGDVVPGDTVLDGLERGGGVLPTTQGIVLVRDVEDLLSDAGRAKLGTALEALDGRG